MTAEQFDTRTQRIAEALPGHQRHLAGIINAEIGDCLFIVDNKVQVTVNGETFRFPARLFLGRGRR